MKTNKLTALLGLAVLTLALTFTACRKDKDEIGEDLKVGIDNAKVQADLDEGLNAANEAFSLTSLSMRTDGTNPALSLQSISICGASVDTSLLQSQKQVTITFDGSTVCNNRIRSGNIVAKLIVGNRWKDQNAVLRLTFNNFGVNFVTTDVAYTYNGTKTITNVSGGLVRNLSPSQTGVNHKVRGSVQVTFEDNTTRSWDIYRNNNYDYNGGNIRFTSVGDTLIDSVLTSTKGVNRFGNAFTVQTPDAITSLQNCGWAKPVSGTRINKTDNRTVTVTFGVDQSGIAGGGGCAYGYKVEWIRFNGQTGSAVIAY